MQPQLTRFGLFHLNCMTFFVLFETSLNRLYVFVVPSSSVTKLFVSFFTVSTGQTSLGDLLAHAGRMVGNDLRLREL